MSFESTIVFLLTRLHSERPQLYTILAFFSAIDLKESVKMHALPSIFFSDEQFDQV